VPLMNLFWTTLMIAGFVLAVWLLFLVLRDVFDRPDLSAGARVAWTIAACVLPIAGSLIYLGTRGPAAGELRTGISQRRADASIYR